MSKRSAVDDLQGRANKTGRTQGFQQRNCRLCGASSEDLCPIRGEGHLIEWNGERNEDGVKGAADAICIRVQKADEQASRKTITALEQEHRDPEALALWKQKREKAIEIFQLHGMRTHLAGKISDGHRK